MSKSYPLPTLTKNDRKANIIIWSVSLVVFIAVIILHEIKLDLNLGFDPHIFAEINAFINGAVATLLIFALVLVKIKKYLLHRRIMNLAIILSALFLVSYIAHHVLADSTKYGGEGIYKSIYYIILLTHIALAALSLPFILITAYRASIAEYSKHKKLARYVYPIWLYVAVTGVVVYVMISPFYS
tara:strand:- start:2829 stop:3383 length:555 start_codon:yes stop_codon:yes gene_type:complete